MARGNRKPRLHTQTVHEISKHSFKKHEWLGVGSEMQLRRLLQNYRREFRVSVWDESDIDHFLELFHYLYPEAHSRRHHVRCIATIIRRMYP
ncbi:MAG: hypothetical protein ACTSWU_00940 [Candidatus Thorarchaeota archaeon]